MAVTFPLPWQNALENKLIQERFVSVVLRDFSPEACGSVFVACAAAEQVEKAAAGQKDTAGLLALC